MLAGLLLGSAAQAQARPQEPATEACRGFALESRFEANAGQWPAAVRFRMRRPGGTVWATDGGWWLTLRESGATDGSGARDALALHMAFEGGDEELPPRGLDLREGVTNWFLGSDPARWRTDVPGYGRVLWDDVAPGVSLQARSEGSLFAYDLLLAPGAELERVVVSVEGHEGLELTPGGALIVHTALGPLEQTPPLAWELLPAGGLRPLAVRFEVLDGRRFGFAAPRRERALAAVVDPALRWSTYLGGDFEQGVSFVASAPGDTVLVAGATQSDNFPTTPGAFREFFLGAEDLFVTRLKTGGQGLVWSTYMGGSGSDFLYGAEADASGALTLVGDTVSTDWPTTAGAFDTTANGFRDGFVTRLAPTGNALLWSTYLGGGAHDRARDLALAPGGEVVVVGSTNGSGFPATNGSYDPTFNGGNFGGDGFVTRLSADGSQVVWSTFVGTAGDEGNERVALGPQQTVTFSGITASSAFPVTAGAFDTQFAGPSKTFVGRLDSAGANLQWATFLGGSGEEEVRTLVVEASGDVLLGGWTDTGTFPLTSGAFDGSFDGTREGFLCRLAAAGNTLLKGTFLGGLREDTVERVLVAPDGRVIVAVSSNSNDLPTTPGAYDRVYNFNLVNPELDGWIARFDPALTAIDYATYFGSTQKEELLGLALDSAGQLLLGGRTESFQFPTSPGALQPSFNVLATGEGFVSRLAFLLHPIPVGQGSLNSSGSRATLDWTGFPSFSDQNFAVSIELAIPQQRCVIFHGFAPADRPFQGARLLVRPPLKRSKWFKPDAFGYGTRSIPITQGMVGRTLYFQAWFADPGRPKGVSMSNSLRVQVYP